MLNYLPLMVAVAVAAGSGHLGAPIQLAPRGASVPGVPCAATSLTGCVLGWGGTGSLDALLGPETLGRVGVRLLGPARRLLPLGLDGKGGFQAVAIVPGDYELEVLWDGKSMQKVPLQLRPAEGAAVEVRVRDGRAGVSVAVRTVGASEDGAFCNETVRDPGSLFEDDEQPVGQPGVSTDGLAPDLFEAAAPHPVAVHGVDDDAPWSSEPAPAGLPESFEGGVMIDPDVNVSGILPSDPLGLGEGDIRAS